MIYYHAGTGIFLLMPGFVITALAEYQREKAALLQITTNGKLKTVLAKGAAYESLCLKSM